MELTLKYGYFLCKVNITEPSILRKVFLSSFTNEGERDGWQYYSRNVCFYKEIPIEIVEDYIKQQIILRFNKFSVDEVVVNVKIKPLCLISDNIRSIRSFNYIDVPYEEIDFSGGSNEKL